MHIVSQYWTIVKKMVRVFPYDEFINQSLREFNTRVGCLPLSADKLHTRRCLAQTCLKRSVYRASDVRQIEIHTVEPLVPDPSPFEVEAANAKLEKIEISR
jgi:hypothetical protein